MHHSIVRSSRVEEYESKAAAAWLASTRRLYLQLARNHRELAALRAGREPASEIARVISAGRPLVSVTARPQRGH